MSEQTPLGHRASCAALAAGWDATLKRWKGPCSCGAEPPMTSDPRSLSVEQLRALVEDLRELESDAEADRGLDTAWVADVARRALRLIGSPPQARMADLICGNCGEANLREVPVIGSPPQAPEIGEALTRRMVALLDETAQPYDWNADPLFLTLLEGELSRLRTPPVPTVPRALLAEAWYRGRSSTVRLSLTKATGPQLQALCNRDLDTLAPLPAAPQVPGPEKP